MKIEEILAVKHLSVEFQTSDGKKQVVKDVSLSLRQGEVLALVGESGCGKTVLCRSILKLLPKSASVTGEAIQYNGQNLIGYNEKEMLWQAGSADSRQTTFFSSDCSRAA